MVQSLSNILFLLAGYVPDLSNISGDCEKAEFLLHEIENILGA